MHPHDPRSCDPITVLASREHTRVTGADVGWMLNHPADEGVRGFRLSTPIARCHTAFPGDYRSLAQLFGGSLRTCLKEAQTSRDVQEEVLRHRHRRLRKERMFATIGQEQE